MKRIVITTALAGALLVPTTALAAPIRECGNPPGAARNLTTRLVPCAQARQIFRVQPFWTLGTYTQRVGGAQCRVRRLGLSAWLDVRCTWRAPAGTAVIRFQFLSGE
jgi:hypothetical protein